MTAVFTAREVGIALAADPTTRIVSDLSFSVARGEALGIVGESGSGKSLTMRGSMGLLPRGLRVAAGSYEVIGRAAMVFQEPLTAMNPALTVVDLIADGVMGATGVGRRAARVRALELMADAGIPDPPHRAHQRPHELSGGLRQRVGIAMALSTDPSIVLCDEPTTALDVTVQAQIIDLLRRLQRERELSILFVSHDLAVVASLCQRIAVMYRGEIVEIGPTEQIVHAPRHPYTRRLLAASRDRDLPPEPRVGDGTTVADPR